MKTSRSVFLAAASVLLVAATRARADYTFTTLNVPGATLTQANGISGNTVVGVYQTDVGNVFAQYGFSETGGIYTKITGPVGATSISANGISGTTVFGSYVDASGTQQGFTETGGVYTTITDPSAGSLGTVVTGISGNTVVGYYGGSFGAATATTRGFTETAGTYSDVIDNNPFVALSSVTATEVTGISGDTLVGQYTDKSSLVITANYGFIDVNGVFTTPQGMYPLGISGDTVAGWGLGDINGFITHVGLIETDGVNTYLIDPLAAETGTTATGTDGSTVIGYYMDASNSTQGFIATLDVPEPTSLVLLACGTLALLLRRRKSGGGMSGSMNKLTSDQAAKITNHFSEESA